MKVDKHEYPIPDSEFVIIDFSDIKKFIFVSFLVPVKNRERRRRVQISKTIFLELEGLQYESYVKSNINNSKRWIKRYLQNTLNEGFVKYKKNNRKSFEIDLNRLSEIEFDKDNSTFKKRIKKFIDNYKNK